MTPSELDILIRWQDERHAETMDRLDRLDSRLDRLETAPRLTTAQVVRFERTASRIENATKWFSPKRVALIASLPGSGGAIYFVNWINHILR